MPNPLLEETHREVLVLGRDQGGALDPDTGQIAPGGICFYDRGEEHRAAPGDVVRVPARVAASLIADGLAVDPSAPVAEPEPDDDDPDGDDADDEDA